MDEGLMTAHPAAKEVMPKERTTAPRGWTCRFPYQEQLAALAHARMLEESGHLDFWREEPDLYE